MTGTKILSGQMLGALLAVLAGLWGATEWPAWRLGFQPAHGLPWSRVVGVAVYRPELFFVWWYRFNAYAPRIFVEGAVVAAAAGFGAMVFAIAGSVLRARRGNRVTTCGSTRWAAVNKIRDAGLTGPPAWSRC